MLIDESEFGNHIKKYRRVLYLCHRNADPDAIGSGFALQQAFGGTLGVIEGLSRTGQTMAIAIGAKIEINPEPDDYELIVIVDTSVKLQLGKFGLKRYALIDHHLDKILLRDADFYIQRPCNSTAEIIWRILKAENIKPSREMALGILIGMISDTGRFKRASPEVFRAAAELLEVGGFDYEDALRTLSAPSDISQRIAVLKAASRAEIERFGDWIIATTEINAFEGLAATALVDLGADVAFAARRRDNSCRISARAGREAIRKGLNLAAILGNLANSHGGEGGGHRSAAALEAEGEIAALLEECKEKAVQSLF